jgi:D-3-phosphoglycerate dehydrogenase
MALTVDSAVTDAVTETVKKEIGADLVRSVTLVN